MTHNANSRPRVDNGLLLKQVTEEYRSQEVELLELVSPSMRGDRRSAVLHLSTLPTGTRVQTIEGGECGEIVESETALPSGMVLVELASGTRVQIERAELEALSDAEGSGAERTAAGGRETITVDMDEVAVPNLPIDIDAFEDLTEIVAQIRTDVSRMGRQFSHISTANTRIDGDVSQIKGDMSLINHRMDRVDHDVSEFKGSIERIDNKFSGIDSDVSQINAKVSRHDDELQSLASTVGLDGVGEPQP